MPLLLFLLPIAEMYLLIRVGGYLGAWPTIALVVFAAFAGLALLRRQGPATLNRIVTRVQAGETPALELADGALFAAAGLLLLLPGFVSDLLAVLLLIPACRAVVAHRLVGRLAARGAGAHAQHAIIEGEFERRPPDDRVEKRDLP